MLHALLHDLRYALRTIRRNATFAAVAVISLALGAGANTAMFSLLDAIAMRKLPTVAPDELVDIRLQDRTHARGAWLREEGLTNPQWEHIRAHHDGLSGVLAWADETLDVSTTGEARKIAALWVSGNFFGTLGVRPALGRVFVESDDVRGCGSDAGIVLSDRFWRREFGGDPTVVGRTIVIGRVRTQVVGVTPPEFFGLEVGRTFDAAIPICAEAAWQRGEARLDSGTVWWLTIVGRRAPGISPGGVSARLRAQSADIFRATLPPRYPAASVNGYLGLQLAAAPVATGVSRLRQQYARPLGVLFGITGAVLLLACVNLAHVMLARGHARARELAIRVSLGASRWRLAQLVISEAAVLAVLGVALGLLFAGALTRMLISLLVGPSDNVFLDVALNARTFGFAAFLTVITGVGFASAAVWRAVRLAPGGRARQAIGSGGTAPGQLRTRRMLLATQVAISLTLLLATALFLRTLRNLSTVDPGFHVDSLVVADITFSSLQLPADRNVSFRRSLIDRVRATAGVDGVTEALILPLTNGNWNNRMWMEGTSPDSALIVMRNMVGTDYFRTLGTPVIAGREFADGDMVPDARKIAIVDETFAHRFGLEGAVVGRHFSIETTPLEPEASYEIVGVVADTKYRNLREDDPPIVYVPLWQSALRRPAGQFIVRTSAAGTTIAALRTTLDGIGGTRYQFRPYPTIIRDLLLRERLTATLAWPFGALALVLTAVGIYGVLSYAVALRTREIAIRMAVGASPRTIAASMVVDATGVVIVGIVSGLALTFALSRLVGSLLFGVRAYDPLTIALAASLLTAVAALAAYMPVRRATSIDPAVSLRAE